MNELGKGLSPTVMSGRIEMRTPDEVSAMLALKARVWGSKRIAAELGLLPKHGEAVAGGGRLVRRESPAAAPGARWS